MPMMWIRQGHVDRGSMHADALCIFTQSMERWHCLHHVMTRNDHHVTVTASNNVSLCHHGLIVLLAAICRWINHAVSRCMLSAHSPLTCWQRNLPVHFLAMLRFHRCVRPSVLLLSVCLHVHNTYNSPHSCAVERALGNLPDGNPGPAPFEKSRPRVGC